jgi:hypothetical protein
MKNICGTPAAQRQADISAAESRGYARALGEVKALMEEGSRAVVFGQLSPHKVLDKIWLHIKDKLTAEGGEK